MKSKIFITSLALLFLSIFTFAQSNNYSATKYAETIADGNSFHIVENYKDKNFAEDNSSNYLSSNEEEENNIITECPDNSDTGLGDYSVGTYFSENTAIANEAEEYIHDQFNADNSDTGHSNELSLVTNNSKQHDSENDFIHTNDTDNSDTGSIF